MSTNYPSELTESVNLLAEQSRLAAAVPLMPFDLRQWLDVTLPNSLGTTKRKRSLDETEILWLSVVLSIFRNASIRDLSVMLGIRGDDNQFPAASSLSEARQRLGAGPLRDVFEALTVKWACPAAEQDLWKGMGVYAMDGTTLAVADSDENYEHFGKPSSRDGEAGYPKLRMVVLLAVRSQMILDARFAPWRGKGTGEQSLADSFWQVLPPKSVLLFDRGFNHVARMVRYTTQMPDRHFVTRQRQKFTCEVLETYSATDERVRTPVPASERAADPTLPEFLELRRITYQFAGHPKSALLTTLLDPILYPAEEIVALYHERWSIELTYRDIKTAQLQRLESLRSKTVVGVEQEVWGLLIAYQLIRKRMYDVAEKHQVEPNRLSFKTAMLAIHFLAIQMHHTGADTLRVTAALDVVEAMILNGLMPPKKRRASYDRAVKIKMSNYPRNRGKRTVEAKEKSKKNPRVKP